MFVSGVQTFFVQTVLAQSVPAKILMVQIVAAQTQVAPKARAPLVLTKIQIFLKKFILTDVTSKNVFNRRKRQLRSFWSSW